MSGFGLRALKKQSDADANNKKRSFFKHIVYGENLAGVLSFLKLNKLYPGEVKLITKNPYFSDEIEQELDCSLFSIRNQEVANRLMGLNPELEIFKKHEDVFFYKDTKFHKFGGRAKSHDLREEEKFFSVPFYHCKPNNLLPAKEELDQVLKDHQLHKILENIEITKPQDLLEKVNFRLSTGENESFECEYLYFCESPKKFFSLIEDKQTIPDELCEYIAPLSNYQAITVYFECDRKVFEQESTIIVPQSMTHDWGSFMIDFEDFDSATNTQNIKALSFIGEDEVQEEDLAKKIRLMKRVIERILPEFAKANIKQTIKYSDEFYTEGINDELVPKLKEFPVKFIGSSAPISGEETQQFNYLSRSLVSISEIRA